MITPTNLLAKLFINGFDRPSLVAVSMTLVGPVDLEALDAALGELAQRTPLVRATVALAPLGIPTGFRIHPVDEWRRRGGLQARANVTASAIEQLKLELLNAPFDPDRDPLGQLWVLTGAERDEERTTIVARLHHAMVDVHTGRRLLTQLMLGYRQYLAKRRFPDPPPDRAVVLPERDLRTAMTDTVGWLRASRVELEPPAIGLLTDVRTTGLLAEHPVVCDELVLPVDQLARITGAARAAGLTFAQAVCAASLRAQHRYNQQGGFADPPPARVGLWVAARSRARHTRDARRLGPQLDYFSIAADTRQLAASEASGLAETIRARLQIAPGRHNELFLWLFYLAKRAAALGGPPRDRATRAVQLSFSDVTSTSTKLGGEVEVVPGLRVVRVHSITSPTALDQALLITHTHGPELRFTLTHHRGAVQGPAYLGELRAQLAAL